MAAWFTIFKMVTEKKKEKTKSKLAVITEIRQLYGLFYLKIKEKLIKYLSNFLFNIQQILSEQIEY